MKVSISWLKELINLNGSVEELVTLLPLRTIGTKEVTEDFIELDMKGYNRADLLSMRGVAQEVAAITSSEVLFKEPEAAKFAWNLAQLPNIPVQVQNPELCPIYCVAKIEGLQVKPSNPDWAKKLNDSGIRAINNVADVTNLVMLEFGQPLHAFDADQVKGGIQVRVAKKGEQLATLDGKVRELNQTDLLIADEQHALGIAGIMGGKDSEISNSTTNILLEAAIFDPVNIRKTVTNLGLPSEAAKRFQHGLTKARLLQALDAAIKMYEQLGGKLTAITLIGDFEDQVKKIELDLKNINNLVGIQFQEQQVEEYLKNLYFKLEKTSEGQWKVEVPYFRLDVNLEEDLIEEVARMYGYEKIPPQEVNQSQPLQEENPVFEIISDLKNKLVNLGLTEVQTYSFYSTTVLKALGFDDSNKQILVKVANPISTETEYLRMNLWPNLVEVVEKNLKKGYEDIAIFEIGKAHSKDQEGNPKEEYRLGIALYNGSDNPLAELYSIASVILGSETTPESKKDAGQASMTMKQTAPQDVGRFLFHPKRFIAAEKAGKQIGGLAEVHLRVLNQLGIENRVAVLEIGLESFTKLT